MIELLSMKCSDVHLLYVHFKLPIMQKGVWKLNFLSEWMFEANTSALKYSIMCKK